MMDLTCTEEYTNVGLMILEYLNYFHDLCLTAHHCCKR